MSYYYPGWDYLRNIPIDNILGIQSIVSSAIIDKEKIIWSKYSINELMKLIDKSNIFKKYEY